MGKHNETEEFGRQLPGTGGDITPTDMDVEGHIAGRKDLQPYDGGPEGAKRTSPGGGGVPLTDEDVEGHVVRKNIQPFDGQPDGAVTKQRQPFSADEDVEGHGIRKNIQPYDGGPEGAKRTSPGGGGVPLTDEDDVEGHLYTGGPSTQGEFVRRAPGDSPHGD